MAKEVIIASWCDVHMADDVRMESSRSITVSLSGWPKPREIDVCADHEKVITDFETMVEKYGRLAGSDAAQPALPLQRANPRQREVRPTSVRQRQLADQDDAVACPLCLTLYTPGPPSSRSKYLSNHLLRFHDRSITEFTDDQLDQATNTARERVRLLAP